MNYREFLFWESTSRDTIDFKKVYVDISGDLIAGLLLSQIVYWHLPSKDTGKSKLQIEHENHMWIAKGRDDWYEEIRITGKQFDRAVKILIAKGLVEKKIFKFMGDPMVHVRIIFENFLPIMEAQMDTDPLGDMVFPQRAKTELPKGKKGNSPKVKKEIDQRSISSYTENTPIEYDIDHPIEYSQSVTQLVKQIASKVWTNIPSERLTDIIACYSCFNDKLGGHDLFRILTKIREMQNRSHINNFKSYLWSCMEDAIKPPEMPQIQTKEPIRKELVPDWFDEENEPTTAVKMDDEELELKKQKINDRLKKFREEAEWSEIEEILKEARNEK